MMAMTKRYRHAEESEHYLVNVVEQIRVGA